MRALEFIREFDPEGYDQYKLYIGDGVERHLVDKFSTVEAAKEEMQFIWNTDPETRLIVWLIKDLNDETVYYYDPQELADAPRWRLREQDVDEMAGSIHVGISQYLANKGYQYLGGGIDKQAYLEPGTGQVLIVFGYRKGQKDFSPDQRMFVDWINYCNKHRNNPHLPRFSGFESFQFHGQNYIQARMEALQELPESIAYIVGHIEDLVNQVKAKNYNDAFHKLAMWSGHASWEGDNPEQYDIKSVIRYLGGKNKAIGLLQTVNTVAKFANKHGFSVDLHRGNYMARENGTIVVNDPFVVWLGTSNKYH